MVWVRARRGLVAAIASLITVVLVTGVVLTMTSFGCGAGKSLGMKVCVASAARTASTSPTNQIDFGPVSGPASGPFQQPESGAFQQPASAGEPYPAPQSAPIPCIVTSPSSRSALVSGGNLPAGASSAPASALAAVFSRSVVDSNQHVIQLIGVDGRVVAAAKANNRSAIIGTCGNDVTAFPPMPLVSTSAGRVYHLDGDTDIRFLAPDGSTGLATEVPGSSHTAAMFSVSPDDRRIAVSVFNYVTKPVSDRLYVEDLAGGGHHVELGLPPSTYVWPAGWHGGSLVVGVVSATPTFGFYTPIPRISRFVLLEPASGKVVATLAGDCAPLASLPSPAGVACRTLRGAVGVMDWTGSSQLWATGDTFTGGASLSMNGATLAASGQGAFVRLITSPASGSNVTSLGQGYPEDGGWIDATHLVIRAFCCEAILDIQSGNSVSLPGGSVLAARLPGDL